MTEGASTRPALLRLEDRWQAEGHRFVRWCPASQALLRRIKQPMAAQLTPYLSGHCFHLQGRGGVKGAVRRAQALTEHYRFAARLDIRSYYESLDHGILMAQLQEAQLDPGLCGVVRDYLRLPDPRSTGRGLVAGGAISPLLGAVYLTPLDRAMQECEQRAGIRYLRFMDDFVLFAPTRHKLKAALRRCYAVLDRLKRSIHPDQRFIGKTQGGFDFLGYRFHPNRKLRPGQTSLDRLFERARRLQEQGADITRLRQYVQRWFCWLHGGLLGRVSRKGRCHRLWISVVKHLARTRPSCPAQQVTRRHPLDGTRFKPGAGNSEPF